VVTTLPSTLTRLSYLALFGIGSTVGMAVLSGLLGWPLARLGGGRITACGLSLAVGGVSTALGLFWGYPLVARLVWLRLRRQRAIMTKTTPAALVSVAFVVVSALSTAAAQNGGGTPETWWVNKTKGGVYHAPMRPLWKLSDLKRMHAGQNDWQEQIIK